MQNRIALAVTTCGSCKQWHDQGPQTTPDGTPVLGKPHKGECRERLRSQGLIQMSQDGPRIVAWLSGYPSVPADFPACGQFEQATLTSA